MGKTAWGRAAVVALVSSLTVASLAGATLAADASSAKSGIAANLDAAADTGHHRVDRLITKAADTIRRGLAADAWIDGNTPSDTTTFRADGSAARKLARASRQLDAVAGQLGSLTADLAAVDRSLAVARIDEAKAAGAAQRKVARAEKVVARGDARVDDGRYPAAIGLYGRAWRIASSAIGDVSGGGDAPGAAVSIAVNYRASYSSWTAGDNPPGDVVFDDEVIDFQYVVTNIGSTDLTDVTLTDSMFAGQVAAACSPPALAPGETYTCVVGGHNLSAGAHENTGIVTATGDAATVSASDPVYLTVLVGS